MKVLIAGGGIGGLAAAIALRQRGCDVQVFERAAGLTEVGAGISLWANAVRALARLGLGDAVRAIGIPATGALRQADGTVLSSPAPELVRRFPDFCLVVHRAELQSRLVEALGLDHLTLGAPVERIEQDHGSATLHLEDGRHATADVVVGADGIRSAVRAALHGDAPPQYAGYTAWRAVTTCAPEALTPGETWGAGVRFGQMPLPGERVYWFAAANAAEGARSADGERAALLRRCHGWHAPIEALIAKTPEDRILRNDIYDRQPLSPWGRGRVTLLGDAAHPMTPNLGQGACQAIEDAVVLARSLDGASDVPAALRAYEATRRARTDAIVRESRQIGQIGQWQHPLAVRVRNLIVRHVPARIEMSRMAALLGHEA